MNRALLSLSILAMFPVAVACSSSSSGNGSSAQGDAASPGADASQTEDSSTGSGDSSIATDSGTGSGEDSSPGNDSGGGGNDAAAVAFGANVYASIIAVKCLGCHGPTADGGPGTGIQFGHLDMSTQAAAYANLVGDGGGVPADGVACGPLG